MYAVANELGKTWKANAGGNLSGSTTSTQVMPGDEVQFVAGKNLEVKQDLATGSQKYTYSLKKDVDLGSTGSLKAGPVTINNNGIDAGSKKITNVAPGTADTDAANVSQVKAAKTEVKSPDSSINVTTDNTSPDGHTIYNVTIDKSGKVATGDTVNTAINNAKTDLINNNPLKFGGDSGTAVTRKLGEQLDIKGGATGATTSGNIAVIADRNNTLNIQLAKNLTGLDSITTNGGNTVINNNGITTPKVTINNAPTAGTDATNKDYVDSTKTKVTSNDSSVVVNKTTNGNQDVYDLSVDVTKLDVANKSLSNINNTGNSVISDIARKSINVVAGTNVKDIVKSDVQNSDGGTTTTTYKINANGSKVIAGDGVMVATGVPGSDNITDYTVSVKNTTLSTTGTTVTAGDNNSYAKAGDVALAITKAATAARTTVSSTDNSVTINKTMKSDGHFDYDLSLDTSKISSNVNLTYKANGGTSQTTTLANGLDFKDGDNTKVTVGANGEVKYSLNPTITGINSITTNGGGTIINNGGITTPTLTLTNSTPLISSAGGKVTVPTGNENQAVTAQTVANAINNSGWNVVAGNTGTGTTSGSVSNKLITPGEIVKLQAGDNLNVDQSGGTFTYSLKKDISLDSVTTGDTKVANSGITIGAGSNQVSLTNNGLNNGGNRIINVAAGTNLAYKANGSNNQVTTLSNGLDFKNGDNTVATVGANGEIKYSVNPIMTGINSITTAGGGTTINNNEIEITGEPSVTSSGIDAGGKKITNIAEGDIKSNK